MWDIAAYHGEGDLTCGVLLAQENNCRKKFLGILIDTEWMECRLLEDKLNELKSVVAMVLGKLQSLQSRLNFPCRIMPMRRIFCRCLAVVTGICSPLV